ncbi:MAG: UbiA family prenyltransferase, partial [Deltaproteobacteria bacterium]|nr:UbiA family prenyltransferase [Deltaproteobacteria bacterium]
CEQLTDHSLTAWFALATALVAYLVLRPTLVVEGLQRLPQIALGPALVLLGAAWAGKVNVHVGAVALAFAGAALVFALCNKHYDRREDEASGVTTEVNHDDAVALYGWALLVALSLWKTHLFAALCLVLFLVATYAYHGDPLRTKCVFPLSYKSEGFFAASAFVAGLLATPGARLDAGDALATFLIFGGFFLSAPAKDAKDIAGDRAAGVRTLYVVLEERGVSFAVAHAIAGASLAACLAVPIVYLALRATAGPWLGVSIAIALVAVLATRLPWRRLGVGVMVGAIALYCASLALGLLCKAP